MIAYLGNLLGRKQSILEENHWDIGCGFIAWKNTMGTNHHKYAKLNCQTSNSFLIVETGENIGLL